MALDIYYEALLSVDFYTATDQTAQLPNSIPFSGITTDLHLGTNVKIYFGASDKHTIYSDDTDLFISSSSGDVQISGAIYAATHMYWGDNDRAIWGAGEDGAIFSDGTALCVGFSSTDTTLKLNNADVAAFTAAADTSGTSVHFKAESGGAHTSNDPDGASIIFTPGAKGATGAGADGVFSIKDPGSADTIAFYHDGTRGHLTATGYLRSNSAIRMGDGITLGFGKDDDWKLRHQNTPTNHFELLEGAVPALGFYGSTLVAQSFVAVADTAGNDLFTATQTAGAHTSNNPRGGNWNIELGTGTGTGVQGTLSVNGPVTITPATAITALAVSVGANDVEGMTVTSTAATVTNANLTLDRSGLTTTSTDGLLIENSTVAVTGERVQYSPRIRQRGHAWDTDGSSDTWDYIQEVRPASAATTTANWTLGVSKNGAAPSAIMSVSQAGTISATTLSIGSILNSAATLQIQWSSFASADSAIEMATGNWTNSSGVAVPVLIKPKYTQSATAGSTALAVSVWEASVGSSAQLLGDFGTTTDGTYGNHTSKWNCANTGLVSMKSLAVNRTAVGAATDTARDGFIYGCDTVGADTITLKDLDLGSGRVFVIKDEGGNASAQNVTITPESGTIDGVGNLVLNVDYQSVSLYNDGTNWFVF